MTKKWVIFVICALILPQLFFLVYICTSNIILDQKTTMKIISQRTQKIAVQKTTDCQNVTTPLHTLYHKIENPFFCFSRSSARVRTGNYLLPYGIYKAERYFEAVANRLPKSCTFPESLSSLACKNCIVVGNGGILRNSTLGKFIDSYDVIIRLNSGPVKGYEEDVGKKTTFRICYPESIFSDPSEYDPDTIVILNIFKVHDLRWLMEVVQHKKVTINGFWQTPAQKLIYKENQVRILNPFFIKEAASDFLHLQLPTRYLKTLKPKHPTTGVIGIAMALHICDTVAIAGFKYNTSDSTSFVHYYGNITMSSTSQMEYHDIPAEQAFLKDLKEKKLVHDLTEK
ncbi:type 2 lactosamine alpha-2,3-sialyltransferase isoform X2 [Protopterus annectens]|nr:type 2 lactosamine alpha-2,3-sialyltransferase isoform X2 [Protopterus annectens]XP_043928028.1 type 2 lactosamine alpha-2,3-sialyltransferase isoform X2 [Protopterus annectens]